MITSSLPLSVPYHKDKLQPLFTHTIVCKTSYEIDVVKRKEEWLAANKYTFFSLQLTKMLMKMMEDTQFIQM